MIEFISNKCDDSSLRSKNLNQVFDICEQFVNTLELKIMHTPAEK
jgi:hypothetical protein